MDATTILLISRGTMTGGEMIGRCLAEHEGISCLTREDLLVAVNGYGDLATRVTARLLKVVDDYQQFSELRRPYQILMKRALLERARQGRLAYFGYSGHLLLNRVAHFVRVRLIAPMELRVARARQKLGCSEAEAREYVRHVDHERLQWARWMYGVDIRDPGIYDVCVNIERLSLHGACDMLRKLTLEPDFQPTPESVAQVENEYLATQALASLALDSRTMRLELAAGVEQGALRLVGPYLSKTDRQTALSVAEAVPGVRSVEYETGYAPAFTTSGAAVGAAASWARAENETRMR